MSDCKGLRSLYAVYQTVCSFDNYCHSCVGPAVDCSNYLHPGTSDWPDVKSDDSEMLLKRFLWVDEMTGILEEMAISAAKRWEDAASLVAEADTDAATTPLDLERFDK